MVGIAESRIIYICINKNELCKLISIFECLFIFYLVFPFHSNHKDELKACVDQGKQDAAIKMTQFPWPRAYHSVNYRNHGLT